MRSSAYNLHYGVRRRVRSRGVAAVPGGFIFALMKSPLRCPGYTCISKRAKSVNVSFKTSTRGEIAHLAIDSTGRPSVKVNGK
ncbi:transposase [[Pantoea] beijingensis]|uniref:transposase n=2 Tax=[Pantoea] beijingensis TaxID=1324864 RepID=UPI0039A3254F